MAEGRDLLRARNCVHARPHINQRHHDDAALLPRVRDRVLADEEAAHARPGSHRAADLVRVPTRFQHLPAETNDLEAQESIPAHASCHRDHVRRLHSTHLFGRKPQRQLAGLFARALLRDWPGDHAEHGDVAHL